MSGKKSSAFYAVKHGRVPGIYHSWPECQAQVKGFANPKFRKFPTEAEAREFVNDSADKSASSSQWSSPKSDAPSSLKRKLLSQGGEENSVHVPNAKIRQWCEELKSVSTSLEVLRNVIKGDIIDFSAICSRLAFVTSDLEQTTSGRPETNEEEKSKRKKSHEEKGASISPDGLMTDDDGFVVVYTDGACEGNGKVGARAGIGVYWSADHPWNVSEPVKGDKATNNTGEIQAIINAVTTARSKGVSKLKVKTDSQFVINCVTKWMPGWKKKGWKTAAGHEVKNRADLVVLDEAMEAFGRYDLVIEYVPAHVGVEGNEAADRLAVQGAKKYKAV